MSPEKSSSENLDNPAIEPERDIDSFFPPPGEVDREKMEREVKGVEERKQAKQAEAERQKLEEMYNGKNNVEVAVSSLEVPRKPGFVQQEQSSAVKPEEQQKEEAQPLAEQNLFARASKAGEKNFTKEEKDQLDGFFDSKEADRLEKMDKIISAAEQRVESAQPGTPEKPIMAELAPEPGETAGPQKAVEDLLALNDLQSKVEKLKKEVEQLKSEKDIRAEIDQLELEKKALQTEALASELERLLDLREKMFKDITGRDLESEAKVRAGDFLGHPSCEEYIGGFVSLTENRIRVEGEKRLAEQEFPKLSKKERNKYDNNPSSFLQKTEAFFAELLKDSGLPLQMISDGMCGFLAAGYKIQSAEKVGFFSRRIENLLRPEIQISKLGGKKIRMSPQEFAAKIREKGQERGKNISVEAKAQLEKEWENEVRKQTEKIIEEETRDIDGAIERVKAAYKEMREDLVSKYLEGLDGGEDDSKKLKAIEKVFDQKGEEGKDIQSFFDDILNKKGELGKLTGDPKKDGKVLKKFLKSYGGDAGSDASSRGGGGGGKAKNQEESLIQLVFKILKKVAGEFVLKPARA